MQLDAAGLLQIVIIVAAGVATGIIGGIAGYGSALLLPLVLTPLAGGAAVVPIIAVTTLFSNSTRAAVYRRHIDWPKVWGVTLAGLPGTILGAWGYAHLNGREALLLIGSVLIVLVPLRRWLKRKRLRLETPGLLAASVVYGLISGSTTGAGVILLSLLLWSGCSAQAVLATDATISVLLAFAKVGTFQAAGALPWSLWVIAILLGLATAPGASIAKRIAGRLTFEQHLGILDGVVVLGGLALIWQGLES